MKEKDEGFSMPLSAPAYTPPPFYAHPQSKLVLAFFKADDKATEYEIPEPLEPGPDRVWLAWVGDLSEPPHNIGFYHEALLAVQVKFKNIVGWYIPYLWVSNDEAMLFARELYGWPGQLCDDDTLLFAGSQIYAPCNKRGYMLMCVILNITSPPPAARKKPLVPEYALTDFLQIRKIPSPEKNGKPLKQLVHIKQRGLKIHETWGGPASVEIGQSGFYPHIHRLQPTEVLSGYYLKSEWLVDYAKIIWEKNRTN
ncbi:MAG: acetoacetate decarboxylase family protein [Candidatus Bathyarchaeia archaeon]